MMLRGLSKDYLRRKMAPPSAPKRGCSKMEMALFSQVRDRSPRPAQSFLTVLSIAGTGPSRAAHDRVKVVPVTAARRKWR